MYVTVSGYFITHCRCMCASLDPCLSLSLFVWIFLLVFGYVVTNCTYIGTFLDPRFSLFFVVCVSVSGYIIGKFSLGISILVIGYIITQYTCIYISWSVFLSLSHWMPISVFGYIVSDYNYVGTSPDQRFCLSRSPSFSFCLNVFTSVRLYCHSLYVYMYVSWSESFSLCFPEGFYYCSATFFGDCTCIGTSLETRFSLSLFFSLSFSLSQCLVILSVILCIWTSAFSWHSV